MKIKKRLGTLLGTLLLIMGLIMVQAPDIALADTARIWISTTAGGTIGWKEVSNSGAAKLGEVPESGKFELTGTYGVSVGSTVELTAKPNSGYTFIGWYREWNSTSPELVSKDATYRYSMTVYDELTAVFVEGIDPYIDFTADKSVSYVTGTVYLTGAGGTQAGYNPEKTIYGADNSKSVDVSYSNPRTSKVQGMLNDAYVQVYNKANAVKNNGSVGEFRMSVSDGSTGRIWDNRVYTTTEYVCRTVDGKNMYVNTADSSDSYIAPSEDEIGKVYRVHTASGDYGKETFYEIKAEGYVSGWTITVNNDGNGSASANLAESLAGETVSLTATPKAGYEFDKWEVVSGGAKLANMTSASTTFTMPKANVEVKATFKQKSTQTVEDSKGERDSVKEPAKEEKDATGQEPTKEEKAVISMNAGLKISQTGSKINIKWGRVSEADGYDVYVAYCSKKFGKAAKTIKKNSTTSAKITKINGKKINLKQNYKVYVAAYKITDGKKEVLAKTITGHVVGRKNAKYSNAKKITLSKSKYTVEVGKTVKVKAKTVLVDKRKKQLSNAHAAQFRYASSNKSIATVDKKGKIKGIAKGSCTIYVYARNGYAKTVGVTVK